MLLSIDVGNTNTVMGLYEANTLRLVKSWRLSTHPLATADELSLKIGGLLSAFDATSLHSITQVTLGSVVPAFTERAQEAVTSLLPRARLHIITHRSPWSFDIEPTPADSVGADRLINAEAALHEYGAPAIIVDSGTATTVCALAALSSQTRPHYLGGAIVPGLELSRDALAAKAAKLYAVELIAPEQPIGRNTTEAIQSGLVLGYAALIDGLVGRFRAELNHRSAGLGDQARVIGTGGVCARLKGITKSIEIFDPELTLKGLAYVSRSLRQN